MSAKIYRLDNQEIPQRDELRRLIEELDDTAARVTLGFVRELLKNQAPTSPASEAVAA